MEPWKAPDNRSSVGQRTKLKVPRSLAFRIYYKAAVAKQHGPGIKKQKSGEAGKKVRYQPILNEGERHSLQKWFWEDSHAEEQNWTLPVLYD